MPRIPSAGLSGVYLADFLAKLGREHYLKKRQQLFIVAHSLGCRVVLEAMLSAYPEVLRVTGWAAAG